MSLVRAALVAALLALACACGRAPPDDPVARVNGRSIDRASFAAEVDREIQRQRRQRAVLKPGIEERIRETVLRRMVEDEIVAQKARSLGIGLEAAEERAGFEEVRRQRYPTPPQWNEYLERTGHTEASLREEHRRNLLREKVLAELAARGAGDRRTALERLHAEARIETFAKK